MALSQHGHPVVQLIVDGVVRDARQNESLVDVIARVGGAIPHVCYHPQLGAIQTCDTCMVEVNGELVRACATGAAAGMIVSTASAKVSAAQIEAFDRILSSHLLCCT